MNPFEFVIAIIVITGILSLMRARMGIRRRWETSDGDDQENLRLRTQVKQMQERINVLEKIVTDRGAETAAQIEALRDRDRISEGDEA